MIAKNQKGLAPIILIAIVAVVAIGGFLFYQGQNKSQAPASSTTSNSLKDYFNPVEKVEFKYPSDWKETEYTNDSIIKFLISKDTKADFRLVTGDAFEKDSKIQEYSSEVKSEYDKQQIEALSKIPGFSLINQSDLTVNGLEYHQVEYTTNVNNQSIHTYQIWTVKNNRNYGFSYNATPENYQEFLPVAQNIFNSIEIW